ncbi:hypothetical protein L596_026162 [Steinernema carpocapsae]|uniref:Uncharacterized protein n=1 Tax=Steinernema carpocapsae TaxID=34508 RepID=A0A4U5M0J1_STECR|nr:hypothetical protein L596_026162 [Steinernema carpocapsae]
MKHVPFKFIKATTSLIAQDSANPEDSFEDELPESPFSSMSSPWGTQYDRLQEKNIYLNIDIKENGKEVTFSEDSGFLDDDLRDPKTWNKCSMHVAVENSLAVDNAFEPLLESRKLNSRDLNMLGKFFATMKQPLKCWNIYNIESLPQTVVHCLKMCPWIEEFSASNLTFPFLDPPILKAMEVATLAHLGLSNLQISLTLSSKIIYWVQTKNFQTLSLHDVEIDFGHYDTLIKIVYEIARRLARIQRFHEVIVGNRYEQVQTGKIFLTFNTYVEAP